MWSFSISSHPGYLMERKSVSYHPVLLQPPTAQLPCILHRFWHTPSHDRIPVYSAAQNYTNQNIRVIRVSPIRTYAYTYTHIRVYSIRAYAWLVCMSWAIVSSFVKRSLLFSMTWQLHAERERVIIILNTRIRVYSICAFVSKHWWLRKAHAEIHNF